MALRLAGLLGLALLVLAGTGASGRLLHQIEPTLDTDSQAIAAAINTFGSALFDELATEKDPAEGAGQVVSPFSVAQALAMLLNGAEEGSPSAQQLQAWLGPELPLDAFNEAFSALTADVTATGGEEDSGLAISNANSAWLKAGYTWQDAYVAALQQYYNATLENLTTAKVVNDWVSEATRGKITDIVTDDLVKDAILMLVNAVYFKGQWINQFQKEATAPADFTLIDGTALKAPMMQQRFDQGRAMYTVLDAEVDGAPIECPAIRLAYNGVNRFSSVVTMPAGNLTADLLGGQLGLESDAGPLPYADALAACRRAVTEALGPDRAWPASEAPINLYLPRFKVEFSASLVDALKALNVTAPFGAGDLTKMAELDGSPVLDLAVSEVIHKTFEQVDEKGTEASAVTLIAVGVSAPIETNPPIDLRFDRPFSFDIVHDQSGLELFNGEIYKPDEWKEE